MGTPDHDDTSSNDGKIDDTHQNVAQDQELTKNNSQPNGEMPGILSAIWEFERAQDPSDFEDYRGDLVRLAIAKSDWTTLKLIYQVHQVKPVEEIPLKLSFDYSINTALSNKQFDMFKRLVTKKAERLPDGILGSLVHYARLDLIQWMYAMDEKFPRRRSVDSSDVRYALKEDSVSVELFEWLDAHFPSTINYRRDCFKNAMVVDAAAGAGHLDVVLFLYENHVRLSTKTAIDKAAEGGHFDVVQFLHENRTEGCSTDSMDYAAWFGHLDVVKLLQENRFEGYTQIAMFRAALEGHLEVLKYLHANRNEGCDASAMGPLQTTFIRLY